LLHAIFWLWIHLLQCNVSNQYTGAEEDAINKPWRPIPAGRITLESAWRLRVALPFICLAVSAPYGHLVMLASIGASASELWYDELGGAKFWATKNLCSAFAYSMAELGATLVASRSLVLDETAVKSLIFASIIFASTLHAADFPDVVGDKAQGRVTLPMLFPEASRTSFAITVVGWSFYLASSSGWAIGPVCSVLFVALGVYVGARVVLMRSVAADKMSYNWYDVSTMPLRQTKDMNS
jgi:4-hydroxybenzoate polyprenyltransferase